MGNGLALHPGGSRNIPSLFMPRKFKPQSGGLMGLNADLTLVLLIGFGTDISQRRQLNWCFFSK